MSIHHLFKKPLLIFILACFLCSCTSDTTIPKPDLSNYFIEDGLKIEIAACEPTIEAPVALEFDEKGRMWVVELQSYMVDLDGQNEEAPNSRIVVLEDVDGDGYFEKNFTFLDSLITPRAIALAYGGVLYAEPPNLWWVENINDKPGERVLIDSNYAIGGNIEHQANCLLRNIDNWWYSAKSDARYRRVNGAWIKQKTWFRGQWGITKDNYGRLYYNDNSNQLYGDYVLPNQLLTNPYYRPKSGMSEVIVNDQSVYPLQATAVNRGYIDGNLDEENKLKNFTSACGPLIYRGDNLPQAFIGNAFVCGPEVNLVKRNVLNTEDLQTTGQQAYADKEFFISADEAFRPVNLYDSPDGSIYVVDMHRGIIQHKVYMTAYLRELLEEKGLDSVVHFGRILKISAKENLETKAKSVNLSQSSCTELLEFLKSKNGWVRDKAQQLLIEKACKEVVNKLEAMALDTSNPLTQLHAIWTLEGLAALQTTVLKQMLETPNEQVVASALHLLEQIEASVDCSKLLARNSPHIDLQICSSVIIVQQDSLANAFAILKTILDKHAGEQLFYDAAIAGLTGYEPAFSEYLIARENIDDEGVFQDFIKQVIFNIENNQIQIAKEFTNPSAGGKTNGLALYQLHCSGCHGPAGKGIQNLAPPLYHSDYLEGDPSKLILIVLHGLQGPVHVNGQLYELNAVMPGINNHPDLDDQDIADILSFVKNNMGKEPESVSAESVKELRSKKPDGGGMYTEKMLDEIK